MNKFEKSLVKIIWLIAFISVVMNLYFTTKIEELEAENSKLKNEIMEVN